MPEEKESQAQYPQYPQYPDYQYQEEEIDLREYLRIILKRRWLIATIVIVITSIVAIYSFMAEPVYRATCQVLIEKEKSKGSECRRSIRG
jgi:uncharacterized protein involved in exopolysaccharide biosynthesis